MKQNARLNTRVSNTIYNLVREDAEQRGISKSKVVREIILNHYTSNDR